MLKIYIAGPYSSDNILQGLENIRRGQRMAAKLLQHGLAVFCPWLDHQPPTKLGLNQIKENKNAGISGNNFK